MREIKFRGLRTDGKGYVYGYIYKHEPPLVCFGGEQELPAFAILSTGFADWNMPRPIEQHEVIGDSIGQFTGLQDKNGVDIYEGDIIEHDDFTNGACLGFKQYKNISTVRISNLFNGISLKGLPASIVTHLKLEVIGNIYQNPELLR